MKLMFQWQKFGGSIFLITTLLVVCLLLLGCSRSPQTVYVPITPTPTPTPISTPYTPPYTPLPTTPTTTSRTTRSQTVENITLNGGTYLALPSQGAGVRMQSGETMNLSWSADGNVEGFIFTENQYSNFKPMQYASAWIAHGTGIKGAISAYIQNSDTYYAVVRNTFALGSPIKLYQAVLTEQ